MLPRKQQPIVTFPNLLPEKAYPLFNAQLEKLKALKGRNYAEAKADEDEWSQLTEKLVIRSFGSDGPNHLNFFRARHAGEHRALMYGEGVPHDRYQRNFEARQQAYESLLRSCIAELAIDLPDAEIKGTYDAGEQYEYYRDVTACLKLAQKEIFIVDPYLSKEIFEVYADAITRGVIFRLLSSNVPADVLAVAKKYAAGGNLNFQTSTSIHDRVIFVDDRVWVSGQSIKDAATKKPTYIVELDEPSMRKIYESVWISASKLI
jgi:hypothetical protein